ncbi:MAG: CopD family protein, partial [Actinomycetota bacterium]
AGVAASGAIYAHVAAGHAAARGSLRIGKVIGQWGHFVGAGVWIGGLAALLIAVRGAPSEQKARAVRRFSTAAALALLLVAASGTFRAITEIDSWDGLVTSGYGRLVLVKVGLILVLAGLGGVNRYRSVPRASQDLGGLRRVGRAELIVAALALAAAAGLASISPPTEVARAVPKSVILTGSDFATSVRVRLQVSPGEVGVNRFVVTIRDYDSGEPVDATRVALRFRYLDDPAVGESAEQAERTGPGVYTVASASTLSLQGRWRIVVLVQREASSVEVPLEFATPCRTEVIPGGPGAPTLWNSKLPGGVLVQTYVDPGKAGVINEVHATYFDASGNELPIS